MQTGVQSSRNALLMSFKRTDPFLVTRRSLGDHVGPTSRRSSSAASFTSTGSIGTKAGVENDSEVSQQELIIMEDDRPQTALERIKNFPRGVKMFLHDCLRYKHINDASRTPLNAWTINHPLRPRKDIRDFFVYDNELCPGRIPRRQYQLQRRLRNELRSVVPLIIVWIPPIIGFIPPLLAVLAPRQVMSHHFHNHYELRAFAQIEYRQRRSVFDDVAAHFSSAFRMNIQVPLSGGGRSIEEDGAGPITDPLAIYAAFADHPTGPPPSLEIPRGIYTSVNDIPRDYLVKLSLAIGINQYLPGWMSSLVTAWSPSSWLRRQVDRVSKLVCDDDVLLLREGHHLNNCESLTGLEVTEACLMRGLPVADNTATEQRQCLTNHLKMVSLAKEKIHGPVTPGFRLFTMHLAPLRHSMKSNF